MRDDPNANLRWARRCTILSATALLGAMILQTHAAELTVNDFRFDGPLGSQGTTLEKVAKNHFKATLGHAPGHTDWANNIQFQILQHAQGNDLRLDVVFNGGNAYRFNEYFHSFSYDEESWYPIFWLNKSRDSKQGDTLVFPVFREDKVSVGLQVPMTYEKLVELTKTWEQSPFVTVRVLGQSLGGKDICRVTVTDPTSTISESNRWVHYFANQHPGEHNSQWRMAGILEWLLSSEGAEARGRSVTHFVFMTSPDAVSNGWYRVNAQGVDMNRSYRPNGSDEKDQAHEAYVVQRDLEKLMASPAPPVTVWSMHTWGGVVETIMNAGPEMGGELGPWTELKERTLKRDPRKLTEPLAISDKESYGGIAWTSGPHKQFGVTAFLCEGGGDIYTRRENMDSGVVLMQGLMDYYTGTKR